MKKIISLFQRNYDSDGLVRNEIASGAEWVIHGEGIATQKIDGTCCLVKDGKLFKRYDAKNGKVPPNGFEPAQEADSITGHWPGWVPVTDCSEDSRHIEAWKASNNLPNGTYELCGPKVQKNPEGFSSHVLIPHGQKIIADFPRTFDAIKNMLSTGSMEGIVWHHPDGRMVKIKTKDFGFSRY